MSTAQLDEWVRQLVDGQLSEPQHRKLAALLAADDDAMAVYVEYVSLHGLLRRRFASAPATMYPIEPAAGRLSRLWDELRDLVSQPISLSVIVSALFITSFLLGLALITMPEVMNHPSRTPSRADYVARLYDAQDAEWNPVDGQKEPKRNDDLLIGQRLDLASGFVRVRYDNGTTVLLEGPAQFVLTGDNAGRLERGKLVAKISEQANGYVLDTDQAAIVDLGTEFGVFVAGERTDVFVFQGEVEVAVASTPPQRLGAGMGASITNSGLVLDQSRSQAGLFSRHVLNRDLGSIVRTFHGTQQWEGIDLEGDFEFAINFGGDTIQAGELTFLAAEEVPGLELSEHLVNPAWGDMPRLGETEQAVAFGQVLHSIVYSDATDIRITLPVRSGMRYQLQLLFREPVKHLREFGIRINGRDEVVSFRPPEIQQKAGLVDPARDVAVVYRSRFIAPSDRLTIELTRGTTESFDGNPYIQALTLERLD